jgi:hypothetical protein
MICPPMDFRMRIIVPNETLRRFHPPIKWDDNPHDQWDWRTHPFPFLEYFHEVLELNAYPFHPFDFHILLLHLNYFK